MRSTLIITSFALSALAIPIANVESPSAAVVPSGATLEKRYFRSGEDGHLYGDETTIVKRAPILPSGHHKRSPILRSANHKRAEESEDVDEVEDLERREASPILRTGNHKRAEGTDIEELEKREASPILRTGNHKREEGTDSEELGKREATPILRTGNHKREEDTNVEEAEDLRKRDASPILRTGNHKRESSPLLRSANHKREEDVEHNEDAEELEKTEAIARSENEKLSGKGSIFNGVGAVVDILKARGLYSATTLPRREAV